MPKTRSKAECLAALKTLSQDEHAQLKASGAVDSKYWNIAGTPEGKLVSSFRAEVKKYYYYKQSRMCCYCSKELDSHKGSFDAEHILDKDTYPQFMFELANISAACKTCNGVKGNSPVLAGDGVPAVIPKDSEAYLIVHPHNDEWTNHLDFDQIGRIVAKGGSAKGKETIRLCGIDYLNAARLADHFLPADSEAAENALEGYFRVKNRAWKRKYIGILRTMIDEFDLAQARAIIQVLEEEMERELGPH